MTPNQIKWMIIIVQGITKNIYYLFNKEAKLVKDAVEELEYRIPDMRKARLERENRKSYAGGLAMLLIACLLYSYSSPVADKYPFHVFMVGLSIFIALIFQLLKIVNESSRNR